MPLFNVPEFILPRSFIAPIRRYIPAEIANIPAPPPAACLPANLVAAIRPTIKRNIVVSSPILPFNPLKSNSTISFSMLIRIFILTTVASIPIPPENDIFPMATDTTPRAIINPARRVQLIIRLLISPVIVFNSLRAFTIITTDTANANIVPACFILPLPDVPNLPITTDTARSPPRIMVNIARLPAIGLSGLNVSMAFNAATISISEPTRLIIDNENLTDAPTPIFLPINSIAATATVIIAIVPTIPISATFI